MSDLLSFFYSDPTTSIELPNPLVAFGNLLPLGEMTVDSTKSIVTSRSARVTKFPIEAGFSFSKGTQIADHMILDNLQLKISGMFSEAPLSALISAISGVVGTQDFGARQGGFASTALQIGAQTGAAAILGMLTSRGFNNTDFPRQAMNGLLELQKLRKPFTIKTYFEESLYTDMVITQLAFPQSSDAFSLSFDMTMEQVQITSSTLIPVDPNKVKAASAASKQSLGKKSSKQASDKQTKEGSVLHGLFN